MYKQELIKKIDKMIKRILYANDGKKEYIVTDINLEDGVFSGYYKDINGTMYCIIDKKILNYEIYDNYTKIGESFDLKEWLNKKGG